MGSNVSWLKIASGTAKPRFSAGTIQQWFLEADRSNRLQVPDLDTCEKVAMKLESILSFGTPLAHPVSAETSRYFKLGLTHLKRDRAAVAMLGASDNAALGASDGAMSGWDARIAAAESALEPFLDRGRHTGSGEHFSRSVAAVAQAAWRQSGREPRALGPASPVTKFIELAARGCGFSYDADCISTWLRRRA
jgi:hypothetical protein